MSIRSTRPLVVGDDRVTVFLIVELMAGMVGVSVGDGLLASRDEGSGFLCCRNSAGGRVHRFVE